MGIVMKFALSGGPSAGKTSVTPEIIEFLIRCALCAIILEETATPLILSGITPPKEDNDDNLLTNLQFQTFIARLQIAKEDIYFDMLNSLSKDIVLIEDRSLPDGKAYSNKEEWAEVLKSIKLTEEEIIGRYNKAILMASAAVGAEKFYTCENNEARTEGIERARELDFKIREAYSNFPSVDIIENDCDFEQKKLNTLKKVLSHLNKPYPIGYQKKYLVKKVDFNTLGIKSNKVYIEQIYLTPNKESIERRIRKLTHYGRTLYTYTTKKNKQVITHKIIDSREYNEYSKEQLVNSRIIKKTRWYFSNEHFYYQYDEFENWKDHAIFEIEYTDKSEYALLTPLPFQFDYIRNISKEQKLFNNNLAIYFPKEYEL